MRDAGVRLDKGQIEVVEEVMADVLRSKTPAQRIAIGFALWTSARKMLTAHLRQSHPDWDDRRILAEVAERFSHGTV